MHNAELTDAEITAGAAVLGDNGKPVGRNTAIMVVDAMRAAAATTCQPLADERTQIKTWQDRYNEMGKGPSFNDKSVAMMAEIYDLRAALAHQSPSIDQQTGASAKPIYQVQFDSEKGTSVWRDATEAAYHTFVPEHRRVLYAAPSPSAEDDQDAKDAARSYLDWWTSIETDVRKSMLVFAHREPERLHALIKQAYEEGQQSVRAAMSQAKGAGKEGTSTDMREYEIWGSSYCDNGTEGRWTDPAMWGTAPGTDFLDACRNLAKTHAEFAKYLRIDDGVAYAYTTLYPSRKQAEGRAKGAP